MVQSIQHDERMNWPGNENYRNILWISLHFTFSVILSPPSSYFPASTCLFISPAINNISQVAL